MRGAFPINDALVNDLVTQFQNGDANAFDDLFREVERFVREKARKAEGRYDLQGTAPCR